MHVHSECEIAAPFLKSTQPTTTKMLSPNIGIRDQKMPHAQSRDQNGLDSVGVSTGSVLSQLLEYFTSNIRGTGERLIARVDSIQVDSIQVDMLHSPR